MQTFKEFYASFHKDNNSLQTLLEMPQHYKGEIVYQSDKKFIPVSINNIKSYDVLGEVDDYLFLVHPSLTKGYVFLKSEIQNSNQNDVLPVLTLSLRDSVYNGYKQAHALRIRKDYSRNNLASFWYSLYVSKIGGIVSDFEHLEGGKTLWRSLIDKANSRGMKTFLFYPENNQKIEINKSTPDSEIWSSDSSKRNVLIVMEKA